MMAIVLGGLSMVFAGLMVFVVKDEDEPNIAKPERSEGRAKPVSA